MMSTVIDVIKIVAGLYFAWAFVFLFFNAPHERIIVTILLSLLILFMSHQKKSDLK